MRVLALGVALITFPLCSYGQSYADSPFYKLADRIPASAHVEGWAPGIIHANGIAIDLSISRSEHEIDEMDGGGGLINSEVDGASPAQVFHYFFQYGGLGVTFGYNLLVQPVEGTDKIKCTFSPLTDPEHSWWHRDKGIAPVALPAELTPLVIQSGQAIAISTYPAGEDKPAVTHYLRLTRMDVAQGPEAKRE